MKDEITLIDIIRPLWLRRYELVFSVLLVTVLTSCLLYVLSETINHNAEKIYHQDIKFNSELDQKYVQLLSDPNLIRKSYLENGFDPFIGEIVFDIINHSSRYDAMKENVEEDTAELLVKTFDVEIDEEDRSVWETYLNLDTTSYQLIFEDKNLTGIEARIIISDILDRFNLMINAGNYLGSEILAEVAFDQNNENLLYINNRLLRVRKLLYDYNVQFQENNFDAEEAYYRADVLMAHIYNKDPSPLITTLEGYQQNIEQKASLKDNLEELHITFYKDTEESNVKNNSSDTQLTVDSVSQLIDLGKDFSQLNNKMDLIDNIYDIDLSISSLEKNIFELNSIQKLYLMNYEPIPVDQVFAQTKVLIDILNYNIRLMNKKEYQQAIFTVGDIYIKQNRWLETNIALIAIVMIFLYSILHIISIYLRNIKIT